MYREDAVQRQIMAKIGYLRVSTQEQRPDRQIDGMRDICDELFVEHASAGTLKRPVYEDVIARLQPSDALVVWSLDRAYRSTVDALLEVEKLKQRGINLEILDLRVDTSTPVGMLLFTVVSAFCEFERRALSQRTKEGMAAAKARGKRIGRPPKLNSDQLDAVLAQVRSGSTLTQIARSVGMAPWSLSRAMKRGGKSYRPKS
ncbi:recombinase family protein [uncultured Roseobacter sp.]|uniref:recombinase family protein n=1 Tax=uncultured Roseobacter sp. TaxID=114847 RepID=UPI002616B702|nr:recombinase family protein [uncultured Roseobacter sp.]